MSEPDASVQTVAFVILVEEAHREALLRDLLDLAERGQDVSEVLAELWRTDNSLAALRERRAHLKTRRRDH
ncbi:hypothetical protein OKC48_13650 [Methylorubrum extorquens]|uniref:hypothetical protein n=1 Tax=Methylorubrum extorquens TaxID=408 RepID=UPI0022380B07|nr:hypothetical protein [Methylorubrum extorquens]UYW29500.1 hypothetical protein OKC48_13650 [Methylorubrum extorquens]